MTQKFRLYRRGCNGRYYTHDNTTGKQESLGTSDKAEALRLLMAKNEADVQPAFNAQIARTYLAAGDPAMTHRAWQEVIDAFKRAKAQQGQSTQDRYDQAFREPIIAKFASRRLLDTRAEDILQLLKDGTVSTSSRNAARFLQELVGSVATMENQHSYEATRTANLFGVSGCRPSLSKRSNDTFCRAGIARYARRPAPVGSFCRVSEVPKSAKFCTRQSEALSQQFRSIPCDRLAVEISEPCA